MFSTRRRIVDRTNSFYVVSWRGATDDILYINEMASCSEALAPLNQEIAARPCACVQEAVLRGRGWERVFPTWLQVFPPRTVIWRKSDLPIAGMHPRLEGLRIVHLSDLHFRRRYQSVWNALGARMQSDEPDLILITGDFVDSKRNPFPALPFVKRFLSTLRSRLGCFGIVGNHDDYNVAYELRDSGVRFLDGKRHVVDDNGAAIELIGLPGAERCDLERAFLGRLPGKDAQSIRIVLSHHPDNIRQAQMLMPDLYLTGHTHGGQICLPSGWPIIRHDSLPRRYTRGGIHRLAGMWMNVSRGLGFTEIPLRLFCPSEVNELRLVWDKRGK